MKKNKVFIYHNKTFKLTHHLVMDQTNEKSSIKNYYDIFSLGMVLIGCFNPKLLPDRSLLDDPKLQTNNDLLNRYYIYLETEGSYIKENHYNFFSLMSDGLN